MLDNTGASVRSAARAAREYALRGNETAWRWVVNGWASADHRRNPPVLGEEARSVLETLRRDGVAVTDLERLTGDPDLLPALQEHAARLEAERLSRGAPEDEGGVKPFLVEMLDTHRPCVDPTGLLASVALAPSFKAVADHYFGLRTKVSSLNVWRNLPRGAEPTSSQLWHRDLPEDRMVLKASVYLVPVTAANGPFTYARGTQPGADSPVDVPTTFDGVNHRVADEDAEPLRRRQLVCTGPAGSVVFADTLGYHRGGWVESESRLLLQIRYSTAAATRLTRLTAPSSVDVRPYRRDLAYARDARDPRVDLTAPSRRVEARVP